MPPRITTEPLTCTLEEAKALVGQEGACLSGEEREITVLVHPKYTRNQVAGVKRELDALSRRYNKELGGVVVAYEKLRLMSPHGWLFDTNPYIHLRVSARFIVFCPAVGNTLKAVVRKKSTHHLGCLAHGSFNISVPRPPRESVEAWAGTLASEGDTLTLTVLFTSLTSYLMPFIRASIHPDCAKELQEKAEAPKVEEKATSSASVENDGANLPNTRTVFDDDSGISSNEAEEIDKAQKRKRNEEKEEEEEEEEGGSRKSKKRRKKDNDVKEEEKQEEIVVKKKKKKKKEKLDEDVIRDMGEENEERKEVRGKKRKRSEEEDEGEEESKKRKKKKKRESDHYSEEAIPIKIEKHKEENVTAENIEKDKEEDMTAENTTPSKKKKKDKKKKRSLGEGEEEAKMDIERNTEEGEKDKQKKKSLEEEANMEIGRSIKGEKDKKKKKSLGKGEEEEANMETGRKLEEGEGARETKNHLIKIKMEKMSSDEAEGKKKKKKKKQQQQEEEEKEEEENGKEDWIRKTIRNIKQEKVDENERRKESPVKKGGKESLKIAIGVKKEGRQTEEEEADKSKINDTPSPTKKKKQKMRIKEERMSSDEGRTTDNLPIPLFMIKREKMTPESRIKAKTKKEKG